MTVHTTPDLLATLAQRPLLGDGAMGTQLLAAGLAQGASPELWNIEQPQRIAAVHQRYRDAGCDLLTTNSFGGTTAVLGRHDLADRMAEINRAAAAIACQVAGDSAWVLGDIGPFGDFLEPVGEAKPDEVQAMFAQQAAALREGGADAIIVETMVDPAESALAVAAAKRAAGCPVIATFAFNRSGESFRTIMGTDVAAAISAAIDAGADVVGANCGTALSLDDYRRLAEQLLAAAGAVPVILQPNAGAPRNTDHGVCYEADAGQMAALARELLGMGVRIIGGCCGTTPDHLRAMAGVVKVAKG
jgi:5-methyltetrahydrofolate--homocysteine methyltransferase